MHLFCNVCCRSVANLQRYWRIMVENLKETKHIDLSSEETLLHVVTTLQVGWWLPVVIILTLFTF